MQENVRKYLNELKENRRLNRRKQVVMLAACLLVVCGVFGMLIMPGLGQEGELVCEIEEHTHTDECNGNTCGIEEHTHVETCTQYTCGKDVHAHTAECSFDYNCGKTEHSHEGCSAVYNCGNETEEHAHTEDCGVTYNCGAEEHTHAEDCGMTYSCGVEEHDHADCATETICGAEEHAHTEECSGYICAYTEAHTHTEECYEQLTDSEEDGDQTISFFSNEDTEVNEGLVVTLSTDDAEALSGESLKVHVNSTCSSPNNTGNATVKVNIGALPEGVSLVGFTNNEYEWKNPQTGDSVIIHLDANSDGTSSVWYNQAHGDTIAFELNFESKNGIMDETSQVTVAVDKTATVMPDGKTDGVVIDDAVELTWTAENNWDPVVKTVSAEKIAIIAGDELTGNKLSGKLTYTITANSSNDDDYGEIWTDYITVKDTLTLPDKISLPAGAKADGDKIVTADGETIITFAKRQGEETVDLENDEVISVTVAADLKTVTYELKILNPNRVTSDGKDLLTGKLGNLSLVMELNAAYLELEEGFILLDQSVLNEQKIKNHVEIQPNPYKGNPKETTDDAVVTVPTLDPEKFEFTKTADKNSVKAGEEITYTITLKNTGETPLSVENEAGEKCVVTDILPEYLYLTDDQIKDLESAGAECKIETSTETVTDEVTGTETEEEIKTYTISWVPATEKIKKDESVTLTFAATVKDGDSLNELKNKDTIKNSATYKNQTAECPVTYKAADITIEKTGAVTDGAETVDNKILVTNGGTVEYTFTVTNNTDVAAVEEEIITDELPEGLTFVNTTIGTTELDESGSGVLHDTSDAHAKEHSVTFTLDETKNILTWNVGKLGANEEITIKVKCSVDTDKLKEPNKVINEATLKNGQSSSCEIGVSNPITLDKKVKLPTDSNYTVGIAEAKPNGTVYDYKIEVSNDGTNPSGKKVELADIFPEGMLPTDDIKLMVKNADSTTADAGITWETFVAYDDTAEELKKTYVATVDGREATVTKVSGKKAVMFKWDLGVITAGETITITYQARLADDSITSGVLKSYTNNVFIGKIGDSVTINGGNNSGKLIIKKIFHFYGRSGEENKWMWYSTHSEKLDDPRYQVDFVIKGVDSEGKSIVFAETGTDELIVNLKDFTFDWDEWRYIYTNDTLPEGTYTVTEKNYDGQSGFICRPEFHEEEGSAGSVTWKTIDTAEVEIKNNATTTLAVPNMYYTKDTVNLQKSVYEIAKVDKNSKEWTSLADKSEFYIDDKTDTYVVYNISVAMEGGRELLGDYTKVASLIDTLPDELSYVGIYYADKQINDVSVYNVDSFKDTAVTNYNYLNNGTTNVERDVIWARDVKITSEYDQVANKVAFDIQFPDYYINGKVSETYEENEFPSKNLVSFLMLCKVEDNVEEGQEITNTVELVIEDEVFYTEKERYKTYRTPYDANQNNGDTVLVSGGNGEDDKTVLTSSVTVVPKNTIVPGIEKNAVSYILQGSETEQSLEEESSIVPNAAVKWEVKVHNDGSEPLANYTIQDVVTTPFHFMTKEEAAKFGINEAYTYKIYDFKDTLISEHDITDIVCGSITADLPISNYTFDFTDEKFAIPASGYAVLTMYTNNTLGSYKAYKNTATIFVDPTDDFSANLVQYGELVKDETGKYIGVSASDSVYAFGEFATVSWKTITEKTDADNTAMGTDTKNYIFVENNSRDVVYTNNIKNISQNDFTDMVVIDVMPMKNDVGVINQREKRGSEFRVMYTGNMTATVLDADGNKVSNPAFSVQFSEAASFLEKDFAGAQTSKWHDTCTDNDRSFRVMFADDFVLKQGQTLVIQYEGVVEEAAVPGAIAWNSFGYQYMCGTESLRAEPPKVGVMIPPIPIIQKEVVDSNGDVQEKDAEKQFTFILWDKALYSAAATDEANKANNAMLCEFTLSQGGYLELTDLKDADGESILEEGKEYVITEDLTKMPEGYSLVGIGEYGGELSKSYSFVYDKAESINILARNSVEQYVKELPETGGFSALAYKLTGALLILSAGLLGGYRLIIRRKKRNLL